MEKLEDESPPIADRSIGNMMHSITLQNPHQFALNITRQFESSRNYNKHPSKRTTAYRIGKINSRSRCREYFFRFFPPPGL